MCHLKLRKPLSPTLPALTLRSPSAATSKSRGSSTPATDCLSFLASLGKRSPSPDRDEDLLDQDSPPPCKRVTSPFTPEDDSPSSPSCTPDISLRFLEIVRSGDVTALRKILEEENCDVNSIDPRMGNTALHFAVYSYHVPVLIKLLAQPDIDVNARNRLGFTPLLAAIESGYTAVVRLLLRHQPDLALADKQGFTAVHKAVLTGNLEILQLLLDMPDVPLNCASLEQGLTPLHQAAFHGKEEIVRLLAAKNADVNLTSSNGTTPLHMAALKNHAKVVKALLELGAKAEAQDNHDRTALHYACLYGHTETAVLLCAQGSSTTIPDYREQTPLQMAARPGFEDLLRIILPHLKS